MLDFSINVLISNVGYLLLIFVGVLIILHFLLVWPKNLSKRTWKKIDYIWLTTALVGILSMTSELRINTAQNWVKIEKSHIIFLYSQIKNSLNPSLHPYYCMDFIKTKYSPADFDKRVEESHLECLWIKKAYAHVLKVDINESTNINFKDFPKITFRPTYEDNFSQLKREINSYNQQQKLILEMEELAKKRNWEKILFFISPFLLIFALALRITKVSGELRHET